MYKFFTSLLILFCISVVADSLGLDAQAAFPHAASADELRLLQAASLRYALNGQLNRSIPLQQKAIALAVRQYGANSQVVADMYFQLGSLALEASEFQKAQNALEQSVNINPHSVAARVKLAELLRLRGHPEAARQQALAAVSGHKFAPEAQQELALCYLDLGSMSKANQQFFNLAQVLEGKAPLSFGGSTTYGANLTSPKVPANGTTATPAATGSSGYPAVFAAAQHSVIRALTVHQKQPAAAQVRPATQPRIQQVNQSRPVHASSGSVHSSRRHGSRSQQHSDSAGSLVPPPPDTSYPGVVPVTNGEESSAPRSDPATARSTARRHSRRASSSSDGSGEANSESSGTSEHAANSVPVTPSSTGSDFLLDWASVKKKPGQ